MNVRECWRKDKRKNGITVRTIVYWENNWSQREEEMGRSYYNEIRREGCKISLRENDTQEYRGRRGREGDKGDGGNSN